MLPDFNALEKQELEFCWELWARDNQLYPQGDWNTWMVMAGRGFGKTRLGAEAVRYVVDNNIYSTIGLIADTPKDARDVMIEGNSGILSCFPPDKRPLYEPSKRKITFHNGAIALAYSAEDPEALRGPQFDFIWSDEFAKYKKSQEVYDQIGYSLRLGDKPRLLITTTPRPTAVMREILKRQDCFIVRGNTYENKANLASTYIDKIKEKEGTRLGRQEIYAEMLEDVQGALWSRDMIEKSRVLVLPSMSRVVIAIDPAVSSGEKADECGIIAIGQGQDGFIYVLEDDTSKGESPSGWSNRAVSLYRKWNGSRIVVESNQGGEMNENLLRQIDRNLPITAIRANVSKFQRAEPVAALYEQGKVKHYCSSPALEDQMCNMTVDFDKKTSGYSPDRVDALVHGIAEIGFNNAWWQNIKV
jgi:phage terminase large subunit-like protein